MIRLPPGYQPKFREVFQSFFQILDKEAMMYDNFVCSLIYVDEELSEHWTSTSCGYTLLSQINDEFGVVKGEQIKCSDAWYRDSGEIKIEDGTA